MCEYLRSSIKWKRVIIVTKLAALKLNFSSFLSCPCWYLTVCFEHPHQLCGFYSSSFPFSLFCSTERGLQQHHSDRVSAEIHLSTLSLSNISVLLPSGKIKYLVLHSEIHSKVLSWLHNPRKSFFFSIKPIISHQIKGIYLSFTADKLKVLQLSIRSRTVDREMHRHRSNSILFFSWNLIFNDSLLHFFLFYFFAPSQFPVDGTVHSGCLPHADGTTASPGQCAHSKLDPGFGSVSRSTGE